MSGFGGRTIPKKLWKVRKMGTDVAVGIWVGSGREDYLVPADQGTEGLGFDGTLKSSRQMAGFNMERKTVTEMTQAFLSFFSFSPIIFISWRLITLQYCSGFCHALTWISHGFTCVPHPEPPYHLPPHPIPLGLPSAPAPSTCLMHPIWTGDLFHTW